jgi:hypothetical protein
MQQLIVIFFCLLTANSISAQTLKKYPISNSGCYAYFFCDPGPFTSEKSTDSSDMFTGECVTSEVTYGLICVKMKDKLPDLKTSEETLIAYLDYLKTSLKITTAAGYGKGHLLKNKESTRGVMDYWKDADGQSWKVKGWTDGRIIAVLYVCSKKEVPEAKANVFLDGLLLPGI